MKMLNVSTTFQSDLLLSRALVLLLQTEEEGKIKLRANAEARVVPVEKNWKPVYL